ncbi:zinc finger protein 454-like isoform X2 [Uranotaenia lowii]|uniref:zinc finger protein 454-like isoform X2 n=1 Tax=Uranotaenia lowii TaxID=190385 RepID=UPI002479154E|nr:zinc finger protein 454-like isoform X2 [Uranotaenia lowii]XP_055603272.1 zinc finger protein 454-like isoform X2 [Uranotaenia lowii]
MVVFELASYPEVCRICLHSIPVSSVIPLKEYNSDLNDTVDRLINSVAYTVPKNVEHLFPQQVCEKCYTSLESFITFRSNMILFHQFMEALVEVKQANTSPIKNLFQKRPEVVGLLQTLNLCNKEKASVDDLLDEFPSYRLAQLPAKYELHSEGIKKERKDDADDFESLSEIIPESFGTTELVIKLDPMEALMDGHSTESHSPRNDNFDDLAEDREFSENESETSAKHTPKVKVKRKIDRSKNAPKKMKTVYECPNCDFKTTYKRKFQRHGKTHLKKEIKRFVCRESGCTEVFSESREYLAHRANHRLFTCEYCGSQFKTASDLKSHLLLHEGKPIFRCEYCDYTAVKREYVRHHVRNQHAKTNSFKCNVCDLIFARKNTMTNHMNIHTKEKTYTCTICEKVFYVESYLKKHVATVHEKTRRTCEYCSRDFSKKEVLIDHIEKDHGIQKRFICDICLDVSPSQSALDAHRKRHENPKHLECGRCLTAHTTQESLDNHLCITYRENYFCCGRDRRHHMTYNKHMYQAHSMRTNVRVKPVPGELMGVARAKRKRVESCSSCEMIFETRALKKKHMETCRAAIESAALS